MRKAQWVALVLSMAGVLASFLVATRVFEAVPHVEDEMAYVWQAEVLSHGQLTAPTPPAPKNMLVPFVVDFNGHRFAKYPIGWPMLLAFGLLLGIRTWVNPLLGGLALWLTFRLGQKLISTAAGLLATLLMLTSPFFLILSGSLDSNAWSLVLSLGFVLAWMDSFQIGNRSGSDVSHTLPAWLTVGVAGLSLGLLVLTRPLTALGVAFPFFLHGLFLLWHGNAGVRWRVLAIGVLSLLVGSLFLVWQFAVTGNFLTDPYTLWWSFDRVGFGPGIGLEKGGFTFLHGLQNAKIMLGDLNKDLFGWKSFSWIFLPFGMWALRRKPAAWLTLSVFASLVACYVFYWASVVRYGPRYYYEGLYGLVLFSAAGILWLAGKFIAGVWQKVRLVVLAALVISLVSYNLTTYLPGRFKQLFGLYGIHATQLAPFQTSAARPLTPALVLVHAEKTWTQYAGLLELEDPWLTSPFIFAWSDNSTTSDARLARLYPNRKTIYYYPDQPDQFYTAPR